MHSLISRSAKGVLKSVFIRVTTVLTLPARSKSMDTATGEDSFLQSYDRVQASLMEEECILIDRDDAKIGSATKKVCHLWSNIEKGMLHRAFSVFLFNTRGELLLQQRALSKITYPDHWTNTCCSHPLNFEGELDENRGMGVLRAAQRKLKHELGIEPEQVPLDSMSYLTRIHYKSKNVPYDGKWGEHEIDYIVFAQRDVVLKPNPNEVKAVRYVTRDDLQQILAEAKQGAIQITPWFQLIVDRFLPTWWNHLPDLQICMDHKTIHRM